MRIIKRNQLIILVISLMLITAGYLNFTSDSNTSKETAKLFAELGDATLVSTNAIVENNETEIENTVASNNAVAENTVSNDASNVEENAIETNAEAVDDTYFTTSKLERENMYSQMLETYQQIYNNTEASTDQKTSAIEEIAKINKTKNAIMIAENLLSAKGFKNIVIFVNENSISVIAGETELKPEQIAQIQNIVSRELNVDAGIIHISTK